jgi:hypothetical protein
VRQEAGRTGASIWFVDEAFFRADVDLRGLWMLKGRPTMLIILYEGTMLGAILFTIAGIL